MPIPPKLATDGGCLLDDHAWEGMITQYLDLQPLSMDSLSWASFLIMAACRLVASRRTLPFLKVM